MESYRVFSSHKDQPIESLLIIISCLVVERLIYVLARSLLLMNFLEEFGGSGICVSRPDRERGGSVLNRLDLRPQANPRFQSGTERTPPFSSSAGS